MHHHVFQMGGQARDQRFQKPCAASFCGDEQLVQTTSLNGPMGAGKSIQLLKQCLKPPFAFLPALESVRPYRN